MGVEYIQSNYQDRVEVGEDEGGNQGPQPGACSYVNTAACLYNGPQYLRGIGR
jgi:hypothetical protein